MRKGYWIVACMALLVGLGTSCSDGDNQAKKTSSTTTTSSSSTTTIPAEVQAEIGEVGRRLLVESRDREGRSWSMDVYSRPNGRQCTDVSFPELEPDTRRGFCDSGLFDVSLGRFAKASYGSPPQIVLIGIVAPFVSRVDLADANGKVRVSIDPVPFTVASRRAGAIVMSGLLEDVKTARLRKGGVLVEEADLADSPVLLTFKGTAVLD